VLAALGCGPAADPAAPQAAGDYSWRLPTGFPKPRVPDDNPMSPEKVDLGRHLFYDRRLSANGSFSCASCHQQARAFSDGRAHALGSTGERHARGSMSLANVAYATTLTWANHLMVSLERQALVPMFGEMPVELGLAGKEEELLARLRSDAHIRDRFARAFPQEAEPIALANITKAIACFERTLISGNSPFDRFRYGGQPAALSPAARRGMDLFFSERTECFHCHGGFSFADSVAHDGSAFTEVAFHNTALYNLDGRGAYPAESRGLIDVSGKVADMGRFKAPTLRNIAVTAPYMHDGSVASLGEAIDHYARGGRRIDSGLNAGDGARSPLKSEFVRGFLISEQEKSDLIEFLHSLTDEEFLSDPRFSDPAGEAP
jgi:cytochrome c peroxidase